MVADLKFGHYIDCVSGPLRGDGEIGTWGCGRIVGRKALEVLLERRVGLLRGGYVAGLEVLAELAEESADWVLLAGGLAGLASTMMTVVVMAVSGAGLLAGLLQILLDGGEVGLRGG